LELSDAGGVEGVNELEEEVVFRVCRQRGQGVVKVAIT
jgi:hypothetical protein